MRFLTLLALAGAAVAMPAADLAARATPCMPTPVGTFTATRVYHTTVPTSPYLIDVTTLITWTQQSVCTTTA